MQWITDKDKEIFSSDRLEMRRVCYGYARLCCYMLIIVNSLAISKIVDLLFTGELSCCVENLKTSLYLFIGALFCSFLTAFFSYFVQSVMMMAGDKYWNDICHLDIDNRIEFNKANNKIYKKYNRIPGLLNYLTYFVGFSAIMLFAFGVIAAVKNI